MFFGLFGKRKKEPSRPADPLAAFDQLIETLDRQAAEVRKSAATLLALKADLARAEERYARRLEALTSRRATAKERGDVHAVRVLEKDQAQAEDLLATTRDSLARAESDGRLLLEAASELGDRVAELRRERDSASARLTVGGIVTEALRERVARFDQALVVDAARDEVERAHALADIYREERNEQGD
ncbi:PspA/IM30 family protein [Myxococcus sp. Y35]|uniref:PspA/IM30 family protein n=1 Tax=Pseudomyxococcus flavus TaxID=3115648 RepID=UPI003CF629AD